MPRHKGDSVKRSTKKLALSFAVMVSVFPFFTNCSEPMKAFEVTYLASVGPADSALSIAGKSSAVNEKALLSADQVLKSMTSVTGVPIDGQITDEYNRQQDVLAGSFNLETVTPPMLMGITNLAAEFCNKLVAREAGIADMATRKQFKTINFTVRPENLQAQDYTAAVNSLAMSFWGRETTTAELANFEEARTAFLAGRDMARPVTQNTNSLMLLICTGMLSSFDSYTL